MPYRRWDACNALLYLELNFFKLVFNFCHREGLFLDINILAGRQLFYQLSGGRPLFIFGVIDFLKSVILHFDK